MDRILLGTDHPNDNMAECQAFLNGVGMTEEQKEMLYTRNAAPLLKEV
jgi:hypothetical protein